MPIKVLGLDPSIRSFGVSAGEKETIVIQTSPNDTQSTSQNCQRRCQEICAKILLFIRRNYSPDDEIMVVLEAPSFGSSGHLYEAGWLYNDLYSRLPNMLHPQKISIVEIPPTTFKKWLTGKGRSKKGESKIDNAKAVKERWGVEFELDRTGDKCDAFGLYKMGVAILEGKYEFTMTARRGQGKGKKKSGNQRPSNRTSGNRSQSSAKQPVKPAVGDASCDRSSDEPKRPRSRRVRKTVSD